MQLIAQIIQTASQSKVGQIGTSTGKGFQDSIVFKFQIQNNN